MEITRRVHEQDDSPAFVETGAEEGAKRTIYAAAALSLVAALVHLWATPGHLEEWWGYGAFMLGAALAQGAFVAALFSFRPESGLAQRFYVAAIAGNLAIVLLYLATRTVGIPFFGPHAGEVESPGLLDMSSTVAEMRVIIALVTLLGGRLRGGIVTVLLVVGAGIWALRLTGLLT